jgi:hypothetical protein
LAACALFVSVMGRRGDLPSTSAAHPKPQVSLPILRPHRLAFSHPPAHAAPGITPSPGNAPQRRTHHAAERATCCARTQPSTNTHVLSGATLSSAGPTAFAGADAARTWQQLWDQAQSTLNNADVAERSLASTSSPVTSHVLRVGQLDAELQVAHMTCHRSMHTSSLHTSPFHAHIIVIARFICACLLWVATFGFGGGVRARVLVRVRDKACMYRLYCTREGVECRMGSMQTTFRHLVCVWGLTRF